MIEKENATEKVKSIGANDKTKKTKSMTSHTSTSKSKFLGEIY